MIKIGNRLKEYRIKSNFTQLNVAEFLGVDQSFISKVEKDERTLTSDMLDKLATLFGVQTKDIIEDTDIKPLAYAFRANEITAKDMETIYAINKIALYGLYLESLLNGGAINENR